MANETQDRVDEFFWRGFIPEENRGGTYHVILFINGKLLGPLTPSEADKLGWPLTRVVADLNAQTLAELDDTRKELSAAQTLLNEKDALIIDLEAKTQFGAMAFAVPPKGGA